MIAEEESADETESICREGTHADTKAAVRSRRVCGTPGCSLADFYDGMCEPYLVNSQQRRIGTAEVTTVTVEHSTPSGK